MSSAFQFRSVIRQLIRNLGFTIPVLLMLSLSLGANATIFGVIHSVLFPALPYVSPDRLTAVWQTNREGARMQLSGPDFSDWKSRNTTFSHLAAFSRGTVNLKTADRSRRLAMAAISRDFFPMLGVRPLYGRWPAPEEQAPFASPVALVSHGLWVQSFGSDPAVVGRSLMLDGISARLIGIMPAGFRMPGDDAVDIYVPLELFTNLPQESRSAHNYRVFGRLADGVSAKAATQNLQHITAELAREYSDEDGVSAEVIPLRQELAGDAQYGLWLLLGAALAVLLICAANLAIMNLARSLTRQRELAVKLALGGRGWRLVAPTIVETVILALLGTAFSLVLAKALLLILMNSNLEMLRSVPPRVSILTVLFTLLLGLAGGAVFSIAPAWWQQRKTELTGLDQVGRRSTPHRARSIQLLVALQLTVTLLLLLGGGELLLSLAHVLNRNPGFDVDQRLALNIDLPRDRYGNHNRQMVFYNQLLSEVKALPGVESAGSINKLPFSGTWTNSQFEIADMPANPGDSQGPSADYRTVSPGYFETMRIPLVRGRTFSDLDVQNSEPVAIISASEVARYFPGQDPLGKYIRISSYDDNAPWRRIIGVVGDVLHDNLLGGPSPTNYIPVAQTQNPIFTRSFFLVVQAGAAGIDANVLQQAVARVDAQAEVEVHSLKELIGETTKSRAFATYLVLGYAGLALLVTITGIVGLTSFLVSRRRAEIGIRMALGSSRAGIRILILKQSLAIAMAGTVLGMLSGLGFLRLLQAQVFGISVYNPWILLVTPVALLAVALLASLGPAITASKIDPLQAIRSE